MKIRVETQVTTVENREYEIEVPDNWDLDKLSDEQLEEMKEQFIPENQTQQELDDENEEIAHWESIDE